MIFNDRCSCRRTYDLSAVMTKARDYASYHWRLMGAARQPFDGYNFPNVTVATVDYGHPIERRRHQLTFTLVGKTPIPATIWLGSITCC